MPGREYLPQVGGGRETRIPGRWHHSLGWRTVLNKQEEASWAGKSITLPCGWAWYELTASLPGLSLPPNHEELDHRTMSKLRKIRKVASVRVVAILFLKDIITTLKITKIQVLYVVWQNMGKLGAAFLSVWGSCLLFTRTSEIYVSLVIVPFSLCHWNTLCRWPHSSLCIS